MSGRIVKRTISFPPKPLKPLPLRVFLFSLLAAAFLFAGAGCGKTGEYNRYSDSFFGTFDTVVQVVAYARDRQEFEGYYNQIQARFQRLHQLYDTYNDYEGINNLKTVNDRAGKEPVKVDREIIDLLLFAREWHQKTPGQTNIALGPVLKIWHDYRAEGLSNPEKARLPSREELARAAGHTDLDRVIIDEAAGTVYLPDSNMRLDVGAVAKGFATELVAREMMAAGMKSGLISAGGNVRAIGKPLDGKRDRWAIGVQNPDESIAGEEPLVDAIYVNDAAIVTSGDYQRYYIVDGRPYHHIIDPKTLMPAEYYRAVTVVAPDAGVADYLSTELFLLPLEESMALAESLEGVEALWIMKDGSKKFTTGMGQVLKSQGAGSQ
ncbi:MAG TPA: FAD:protein FMN transferase [Bacillota bacterium]|jgi:thiamine biosynthesis lipoprotein|nr:FAD:protein FMN transferase [Bacillota bacterium]HOB86701.1 FAD:protein FMN transferase [Bacillota bacterium]HOP69379.1 FAD:protein FMN transferase [Bacillota bacterium]HPT33214.1 FAD:protein FMN transferase [Bacillota bacterium]HPZ65097.1 FAD:protein FMN transferase [Bacillota bacterium]